MKDLQRPERGQTVIDLTVATALLLILGAVLVTALATTQTGANATTNWSAAESHSRQLLGDLAAALRSARPVGWCPTAPTGQQYTTPATECTHAAEYSGTPPGAVVPGGPLIYASATDLWFWDFNNAATLRAELRAPDCIEAVVTSPGAVLINRWAGIGTFTTARCQGVTLPPSVGVPTVTAPPATSELVGKLATSHAIFSVQDDLVIIDATFSVRTGVGSASTLAYTVQEEAALRGSIYEQEQAWDA